MGSVEPPHAAGLAEELKWIEKQPWQNGKIGTTGTSYLAITSLLVAETGDQHVKAVFANYPMADAYAM